MERELEHQLRRRRNAEFPARKRGQDLKVLLQRLKDFGERCFSEQLGTPPVTSFVMVNTVDARTCPSGSGGGWGRVAQPMTSTATRYSSSSSGIVTIPPSG